MPDFGGIPVKVFDGDGKQIPNARVDPGPMMFIAMMDNTAQLVKLRKLEESQIPTGIQSYNYNLTTNLKQIDMDIPWLDFSLINDGPDSVILGVNLEGQHDVLDNVEIKLNETFNLNMKSPVINKLFMKALASTANVRIHAKLGRRRVE